MKKLPRIGITPCSKVDDYVESVRRAHGEPVVLALDADPVASLDHVDAVLLTGGLDVDPSLYGQAPHATTAVDAERDRFEIPLARAALARDVPILAICRGVQVLNVAAGGSLVQDIPSAVTSDLAHSISTPKDHVAHGVAVVPGTHLANSLGPAAPLDSCPVNSRHHQSVGRVAADFIVSAVSPDGVIEAIERPASTFCVGVQWHPENFWRTGEFESLFDRFVETAKDRMRGSRPTTRHEGHKGHKAH